MSQGRTRVDMYLRVCTRECDSLTYAGSGRIVIMWVMLNPRITPGPMLKASLIYRIGDKRIVNIPMVIGDTYLTLHCGTEYAVNTSSSTYASINIEALTRVLSRRWVFVNHSNSRLRHSN